MEKMCKKMEIFLQSRLKKSFIKEEGKSAYKKRVTDLGNIDYRIWEEEFIF